MHTSFACRSMRTQSKMTKRPLSNKEMEKLINLVEQKPPLYDPMDALHRDQVWCKHAWEAIALIMNIPDMTCKYLCQFPLFPF